MSKPVIPLVVVMTNVKKIALFYIPMQKKKYSLAGPRLLYLRLGTRRGSPAVQIHT